MAVQVLSPQNCLKNPLTLRQASLSPFMKYTFKPKPHPNPSSNNKPNPNPNQAIRDHPKCRKPQKSSPSNNSDSQPARSANSQLTELSGQVKILKRGKKLTQPGEPHQPSPTPKVQEHRFFAGSCTSSVSPPPSSLPMPSFLAKKRVVTNTEEGQEVAIA